MKNKVFWTSHNILNVEGLRFFFPNKEDYLANTIVRTSNLWEKKILDCLLSYIDDKSVVIDAGAHFGLLSIPMAKKAFKVISIEPVNYEILIKNINLNKFFNVVVVKCAANNNCADKFSIADFCMEKRKYNSGATYLLASDKGTIPSATIDSIVDEYVREERVSVIKYDVEEMEFEAISGSLSTIQKYRPIIYVEHVKEKKRKFHQKYTQLKYLIDKLNYKRSPEHKEIWKPKERS